MEDHSTPYQVKRLGDLRFGNTGKQYEIESFVVPLYKHVFMAAENAYRIAIDLIAQSYEVIVEGLERKGVSDSYEMMFRLYLMTSRAYKQFRVMAAGLRSEKVFFSQIAYPKFIWVCEYGTKESFNRHTAYGEFVLDATSSGDITNDSVISIRHGKVVTYRSPVDSMKNALQIRNIKMNDEYDMFEQNNLKRTN